MNFKEELLWTLKQWGELTTKMLTRKLRLRNLHMPAYYSAARRLEKAGAIKKKRIGKEVRVSITPQGKSLLRKPAMPKKREDGLATIIIFDVPEEKRRARENLRRYLIRNGFTLLQESVLISPSHVTKELKALLQELDIIRNVTIISGKVDYSY